MIRKKGGKLEKRRKRTVMREKWKIKRKTEMKTIKQKKRIRETRMIMRQKRKEKDTKKNIIFKEIGQGYKEEDENNKKKVRGSKSKRKDNKIVV